MTRPVRLAAVAAFALALLAAPRPAAAQEGGGYLAASGFFLGLTDTDVRDVTFGGIERDVEADNGWGASIALGVGSGGGYRLEVEAAYRQNDADLQGLPGKADIHSLGLMGNVYFEPQLGPLNPYIGAGIGYANVAFDQSDLDIDDDDWVFAYQAIGGAVLKLGKDVGLFAAYRYFATRDPAFAGTDIKYRTHNIEVGLRFGF